jgi:hypothetical protein
MYLAKHPQINKEQIEIDVYKIEILVMRSEPDIYLNKWNDSTGSLVFWDVTRHSLVESE